MRETSSSSLISRVTRSASALTVCEHQLLLLVVEPLPLQQGRGEALDAGQRRAQLVGDGRDQVGVAALGALAGHVSRSADDEPVEPAVAALPDVARRRRARSRPPARAAAVARLAGADAQAARRVACSAHQSRPAVGGRSSGRRLDGLVAAPISVGVGAAGPVSSSAQQVDQHDSLPGASIGHQDARRAAARTSLLVLDRRAATFRGRPPGGGLFESLSRRGRQSPGTRPSRRSARGVEADGGRHAPG